MNKIFYGLWSEWDIGLENILFKTKEEAKKYAKGVWEHSDLEDSFDDCWEEYVGILYYEVVE